MTNNCASVTQSVPPITFYLLVVSPINTFGQCVATEWNDGTLYMTQIVMHNSRNVYVLWKWRQTGLWTCFSDQYISLQQFSPETIASGLRFHEIQSLEPLFDIQLCHGHHLTGQSFQKKNRTRESKREQERVNKVILFSYFVSPPLWSLKAISEMVSQQEMTQQNG